MCQRCQCLNGAGGWSARNAAAAMSTWWLPGRSGEPRRGGYPFNERPAAGQILANPSFLPE
jgi:hypothetical protein